MLAPPHFESCQPQKRLSLARKSWSTSARLAALAAQTPTKSIEELFPAPYHHYLPMYERYAAQVLPPQSGISKLPLATENLWAGSVLGARVLEEDWADKSRFGGRCRGKMGRRSARGVQKLRSGGTEERGRSRGGRIGVVLQGVEIGGDLGLRELNGSGEGPSWGWGDAGVLVQKNELEAVLDACALQGKTCSTA
ncbi:uncharacterized protein VP01_302g3 [Puccinia sorghi]|uniref:Uncharacterized protein n=1 Tax=Puccinia sorghi TaxID=27349 RepID=A0A0L6V1W3_9BASI|nr:uncharacterized protein VP01_302g3 [Puccinia sorghi]